MDPSRLRCAWSRAGPNCLVGNARRCPAGETDLDGLMAKQVAYAHENATRQTVCPWERGRGGMAWHGKMENRKKAFTKTRRGRLSTRAPLPSVGASKFDLSCPVDPKARLDLNAHLPASLTLYLCLVDTLSLLFLFPFRLCLCLITSS